MEITHKNIIYISTVTVLIVSLFIIKIIILDNYYTKYENLKNKTNFSITSKHFKPVVIIHGLNDKHDSLQNLINLITENHPGTEVHYIDVLHSKWSFAPLWFQVLLFYQEMLPIMKKAQNGVILIGFSQGGLIARGIIESRKHNVKTFISLSAPQAGQYGDSFIDAGSIGRWLLKKEAWRFVYSTVGQKLSFSNYWNDPHHQDLYFNYSAYLPYINNLRPHPWNKLFKSNFLTLQRLVLIGGPDDGVISPWQSSHFSFFDKNETVVDFKERSIFTEDTFGLRSLYESGKVTIFEVPNVKHLDWHENSEIIEKYILPWLN